MTDLPPPITPYLEPAAKELAEATDPHPRIYEVPPEKGRDILLGLQSDASVPRPDVDEEWVDVDAGEWGTVRTRIIRPEGVGGALPVLFYIHGAGWVFGEQYANKLREAGVDVTSVRVAGMVHDFLLLDSLRDTRAATIARKIAVDFLRTALHDD
ncbi:hypothetical protein ACF1AB_25640 [Streptomyces sp. NPDC014846]|uniref:hypothetical protein n=1 Tax=unclassified Streptomyces TaxID=2593676 RepID=UPI0036FB6598